MSEETKTTTVKKPFFKSVSFKCIAVLLAIVLISGIFLTFCYALFEVTDEERLLRALGKLYDGETLTTEDYSPETIDESVSVDDAEINAVYAITKESHAGDYIVNVTGKGGYSSGTVTCYVIINITDSTLSVNKITISSNTNQSFISKVSDSALNSFSAVYGVETTSTGEYYVLYTEAEGFYTDPANNVTNHLATGATKSMGAICNAINAAVKYMKAVYLNEVTVDPYDGFLYTDRINQNSTTYEVNGEDVSYYIVTKGFNDAEQFILEITVNSEAKISAYTITKNGSTEDGSGKDYKDYMYTTTDFSFIGLGAEDLLELIDVDNKTVIDGASLDTGATLSNYLCAYAALFATANYQKCINANAEVNE